LAEPHLELGKLCADTNRTAEAIRELEAALERSPRMEAAHYRLGQLYQRTGQTALAKRHLAEYQKLRAGKPATP
jgi:Flp pilus assembly protein TadD